MSKETFTTLDISKVRHDQDDPQAAVRVFTLPRTFKTIECDILIVGGGTGGIAAAIAASQGQGLKICLTEETDWLGGQMTAQGVPITDDGKNFQIETSGSNRSYQLFRSSVRSYYKQTYQLSEISKKTKYFNPGNCWYWVSQLAFEPTVAVKVIDDLLNSNTNASIPEIFLRHVPAKVEMDGDKIKHILTVNLDTEECLAFKATSYIDATELGDLLALSGASYSSGTESRSETGEPTAAEIADPEHVQDYTFPLIVEFVPKTDNTIPRPHLYDYFNNQGKYSLLGYKMFQNAYVTKSSSEKKLELMPFWTYRRLLDMTAFDDRRIANDVACINWYSQDFREHNIIDKPPHIVSHYLSLAKACSLGFLYWLQTEAPRDEGGKGYPEIKLKVEALNTTDGLSKYPYIRESRRGKTITVIKEQDITEPQIIDSDSNPKARARIFDDSVGIGFFPIDIHGKETPPGALNPTKHFQIPLGALLMESPVNLILSCKNIGTTHVTSAAYRLHPIEWAIGEAAGALARFATKEQVRLIDVLKKPSVLRSFQKSLIRSGVPLYWYDDVPVDHPDFEAIQYLAVLGIMHGDSQSLHFHPNADLNNNEKEQILSKVSENINARQHYQASLPSRRCAFASSLYSNLDVPAT